MLQASERCVREYLYSARIPSASSSPKLSALVQAWCSSRLTREAPEPHTWGRVHDLQSKPGYWKQSSSRNLAISGSVSA